MPQLLNRFALFYPMRLVATCFMVVVSSLYAFQFDRVDAFYSVVLPVLLVYPHVVHYVARKYPQNRLAIELRTFPFDCFVVGLIVASTGFTPLPAFVLVTVALASSLAVNGGRQMLLGAAGLVGGMAAYAVFVGVDVGPKDSIAVDVACLVFVFVYFMTFAYSAYNRNALLLSSQTELRERNESLEIEKLRSDRLLLNLVPSRLVAELSTAGGVKATEFDPVTLVAIEMRHFSRRLRDGDAQEVLAHLMHCFKAFDAIAGRVGMEKLKTMGDTYIAIAGLPTAKPGDAVAGVEAALGIREFLADLAESRRAHGKFVLDARVCVHSGGVIGGVVDTAKLSYDVWGRAMKTLFQLLRACPDGEIAVSDATRRLAGDAFEWFEAGTFDAGHGVPLAYHGIGNRTILVPERV